MKDSMRHKDGSHCADRAACRRAHLYVMATTLPPLTTQPSEPRMPCGTVGCILWTDHVAPCVTGDELIVSINDKETVLRERDAALARIERLREVVIVRDPDSGGWECMVCHRVAAYNAREELEHEAKCPLSDERL